MDGMQASPHQIIASPAKPGQAGILHLTLHQIKKAGLRAGISDGEFAKMLNELDLDEEQLLLLKKRDALARMMELAKMSFELGQDIIRLQNDITESIRTIDKKIDALSEDDPQRAHLKQDRKKLTNAQKELETIDEERLEATSVEGLSRARTRFTNVEQRLSDPLERHEHDTAFNQTADPQRRQPRTGTSFSSGQKSEPKPKPETPPETKPKPEPSE